MLAAFLTTVLFSISAVCAQRTSRALGGITANFYRIVIATVLLAAWAHTVGQGLSGKSLPWFLVSGLIGFGIGDIVLYQALPRLGSRLTILIVHCLAAPTAALSEWLWLGTRMTAVQMVAAALILAGVALAIAPGKHLEISRRTFWIGIAAAVGASLGQAFGAVFSRMAYEVAGRAGDSIDGLTAAYQRILAGLVVGILVFILLKLKNPASTSPDPLSGGARKGIWIWVLMNAFSGPSLGVGCFQWALKQRGTGIVLPIVALTPLVIIPFSRYVEGEKPRKRSLVGGIVAVSGVFILAGGVQALKSLVHAGR